jgi:hypothetical protein
LRYHDRKSGTFVMDVVQDGLVRREGW